MPRKRSSWGSVTPFRQRGCWRIRWTEDSPQGRVRRCEVFRGTRRQAEGRLAEIRASCDPSYGGGRRVGEVWASDYWPAAKPALRERTAEKYERSWRVHVAPRWAGVACPQVSPEAVREWLSTMTPTVAEAARCVLSLVMGRAVEVGACRSNPVSEVSRSRITYAEGTTRDATVWTLAQLSEGLDAMRGSWAEGVYVLAAFGGCRVGEALSPRLDELAFSVRDGVSVCTVEISRAVDKAGKVVGVKTAGSRRTVVVAGRAAERLREAAEAGLGRGDVWLADDGFGNPSGQYALRKEWLRRCERAGIEPIPFTNLRNSFATSQHWERGVELEKVSRLMGHARTSTTLRHYDRPGAEDLVAAMVASS